MNSVTSARFVNHNGCIESELMECVMRTTKVYMKRWQPTDQVVGHSKSRNNLSNTISILLIEPETKKSFSMEMSLAEARVFGESLAKLAAE
jgi:hypothetical protein